MYSAARYTAAELSGFMLWFFFWTVNGFFSVTATQAIGTALASGNYPVAMSPLQQLGLFIAMPITGWALHLLGSAIEGWSAIHQDMSLAFALSLLYDVSTTAIGLRVALQAIAFGNATAWWMWFVYIAVAIAFAFLPERGMSHHGARLAALAATRNVR
ncbi:MAG: hypothetical protein HC911_17855, partial [Chloroflexaceae bacterium]|nr:hypothetical protein [Chloroflexaceae bacterium]